MQTNNILSAPLIDLIFDGRNKEYGAYQLRKTYHQRISKALIITSVITAMAFGGVALANSIKKQENKFKVSEDIVITQVVDDKKVEPLPEPEKKPAEVQVKTEKLTDMVIKPDDQVHEPPPSQDDLLKADIGLEKHEGVDANGIVEPEKPDDSRGIIEDKIEKIPNEPFTSVEVDAKYAGNWKQFLEKNLNANVPADNNAPEGSYSVMIQFVVDVDGTVSDIKPLTNHGYGVEAEAVRVIRKSTKWEPAIQNGMKVKAYRKQVITFQVLAE